MTESTPTAAAGIGSDDDRELKARHRAMWASGDYPAVAADLVWPLGERLVDAAGVRSGDRVLDVAAGTGSAAIRAAAKGADVVASDLAPELFEAGRRNAADAGVELDWVEADAERLPFDDGDFDAAISAIGIMFAPHHEAAAGELLRVVRPGGRVGVLSWTPDGFIGRMFRAMKPFAPPLPAGAQPAPLWGDESHVRELLGEDVDDVAVERGAVTIDHFATGAEFRDYFKANYGPTIAVYRRIADDADAVRALDDTLAALGDTQLKAAGDGTMPWEYLLVTATRR